MICEFCGKPMVDCGNGVWTCQHSEPIFREDFRIARDGSLVTQRVRDIAVEGAD